MMFKTRVSVQSIDIVLMNIRRGVQNVGQIYISTLTIFEHFKYHFWTLYVFKTLSWTLFEYLNIVSDCFERVQVFYFFFVSFFLSFFFFFFFFFNHIGRKSDVIIIWLIVKLYSF